MAKARKKTEISVSAGECGELRGEIAQLREVSRRTAARTVNGILTGTYWEIGRRIVQFEQGGAARAEYGAELLKRLSADLTGRFGRGFSKSNLFQMRGFSFAIADIPGLRQARLGLASLTLGYFLPLLRS